MSLPDVPLRIARWCTLLVLGCLGCAALTESECDIPVADPVHQVFVVPGSDPFAHVEWLADGPSTLYRLRVSTWPSHLDSRAGATLEFGVSEKLSAGKFNNDPWFTFDHGQGDLVIEIVLPKGGADAVPLIWRLGKASKQVRLAPADGKYVPGDPVCPPVLETYSGSPYQPRHIAIKARGREVILYLRSVE